MSFGTSETGPATPYIQAGVCLRFFYFVQEVYFSWIFLTASSINPFIPLQCPLSFLNMTPGLNTWPPAPKTTAECPSCIKIFLLFLLQNLLLCTPPSRAKRGWLGCIVFWDYLIIGAYRVQKKGIHFQRNLQLLYFTQVTEHTRSRSHI